MPGQYRQGIDLKHRGYIVVEPSVHASGQQYGWLDWDVAGDDAPEIAEAPSELFAPQDAPERPTSDERPEGKAQQGGRNTMLSREAFRLRKKGHSVEQIISVLLAMNLNSADPPLSEAEVRGIAKARPTFHLSQATSLRTSPNGRTVGLMGTSRPEPPPVPWFCRERLLAGRGHLLVGTGGSSKTRIQYYLAAAAVLGNLPWAWDVSARGSAALFLTEDVGAQVHRVLHAFGSTLNPAERALLAERLRVFPLAGKRALLLELNGSALRETAVYAWLMERIDALPKPVAFIGIDPALGVTEGDEMNPAHQRRLGELVDRIGIETGACVVLNAARCQEPAPGRESSGSTRGPGVWCHHLVCGARRVHAAQHDRRGGATIRHPRPRRTADERATGRDKG